MLRSKSTFTKLIKMKEDYVTTKNGRLVMAIANY